MRYSGFYNGGAAPSCELIDNISYNTTLIIAKSHDTIGRYFKAIVRCQ